MIRAAISGGSGYRAGELARLLLNHPDVELLWISSTSHANQPVTEVHQGLVGLTDIILSPQPTTLVGDAPSLPVPDVLFLAGNNGQADTFLSEVPVPEDLKIVDLTSDHRQTSLDAHHDATDFIYGLSELWRKAIVRGGVRVAVPGAVAHAVLLALLPLAKNLLLPPSMLVNATVVTGSTATGVDPLPINHFSWLNNNITAYQPFTHPDLTEIRRSLAEAQSISLGDLNDDHALSLITLRAPITRGVYASVWLDTELSEDEIIRLYEDSYDDHRFTFISRRQVDIKDVAGTNNCLIHIEKHGRKLLITSVIDYLLKGSAGTAVHAMNLLFGLEETTGLTLHPIAY